MNAAPVLVALPGTREPPSATRVAGMALLAGYVALRVALEARYELFDPDEALEILAADSLRDGKLPYLGALSHRGPFLTVVYSVPVSLFGPYAYHAVHAFAVLLFVALGAWFQRSVARATSERTGLLALAALLLLATVRVPTEDNWALNSDFLMGGLATAALCLLLGAASSAPRDTAGDVEARQDAARYSGVGLLLALAFLTKQNAAPFACVPVAWLALFGRTHVCAKIACFVCGFAAPLLVTFVLYLAAGQVHRAWYFFYVYNRAYAVAAFTAGPLATLSAEVRWLGRSYGDLFLVATAGAMALVRRGSSTASRPWCLATMWVVAGLAAAIAPGKPWDNYLWAAHAPVALLAALGANAALELGARAGARPGLLLAVPLLSAAAQLGDGRRVLATATEVGGIPAPRVPRRRLVDLIRRVTDESDAIFVTGYAPEMYVLAKRRPATRHVISNFVEGVYPGRFDVPSLLVAPFFAELRADLEKSRPRVILDACALGFVCHPSSALTAALPELLGGYHALPGAPLGVFVRDD